jgi:hypothetical protein
MERPRANSGENHGPGRTRMGKKGSGGTITAQTNGWSVRHDPFEHVSARVLLAWTTALPTGETVVKGVAMPVPRAPAATNVTGIGGDAGFRPRRLRRAAKFSAR